MTDLTHLQQQFPEGEVIELKKDTLVCHIHKKIAYIHWLIAGRVSFFVALNENDPEIEVCDFEGALLPIGWNGMDTPSRHTKNISVASEKASFFRVAISGHSAFLNTIKDVALHRHVCRTQFSLLQRALLHQKRVLPQHQFTEPAPRNSTYDAIAQHTTAIMELLRRSPFFEFFDDQELLLLAGQAIRREYSPTNIVLAQDEFSDGIYILIEGYIKVYRADGSQILTQWPIATQGFIFGWPHIIQEREICTAQAVRQSSVYFIPETSFQALFKTNQKFSLRFFKRLNWLIDNHINAAFIRYLSFYFNANQLTIQYLIENYQTQIKISSKLHQIPHLLNHRSTKQLAFNILEQLNESGTSRERRIASICMDLLVKDREEAAYLRQLQHIYETVVDADPQTEAAAIRKACSDAVRKLCAFFSYQIEGWELLPAKPGHIFIYNHLINHPYYTLPNNFQITLESHFISAMILDAKYGDPGIRTVRIGRSKEFAHQDYYEKLGYISVFTKESDVTDSAKRQLARSQFFESAKAHLRAGQNIIVSPEGTSYRTEDSIPGAFKPGAFQLALETDPEPMIVPIIMLHFDKRIHEAKKYCRILPPFRVSEHALFKKEESLQSFVDQYRLAFKQQVDEAKQLLGIKMPSTLYHTKTSNIYGK
ncbi:cyclic nucleotide-binding domain-containing protein [Olivibacter sp. XZL3]|uniref:cyclic nucleotide-binding domain-containing protein n=1 Tax=Olivibacter sp. XZL3 TaxID=1735116 RepID=UPI00106591C4|nr:cyclic nucleotide-binding domain-containing protein [Olivibacter sp. XZL3]